MPRRPGLMSANRTPGVGPRQHQSLDELMQLKPLVKPQILKACIEIILAGGKATAREIELVRTISICLDSPMPPMRAVN